jgi:hypothetical protein
MKYEIKQVNENDAVVISNEEIKINDPITDGYRIWWWRDDCSLLGRKKIIATISPFKIEGLPMLELSNKTPIIDTFWLEKLCYYDRRNPDFQIKEEFGYDKEEVEATGNFSKKDCACDNCFYGRTRMAEKYISELPNQEEDVEKLALDYAKTPILNHKKQDLNTEIWISGARQQGFIAGYKAAQNKKYSEKDIINAFDAARKTNGMNQRNQTSNLFKSAKEYLQSLQKKQFPIAVELTEEEYCLPMPNIHVKKYKLKVIKWYYEKES